jgi:hypothetical protein
VIDRLKAALREDGHGVPCPYEPRHRVWLEAARGCCGETLGLVGSGGSGGVGEFFVFADYGDQGLGGAGEAAVAAVDEA